MRNRLLSLLLAIWMIGTAFVGLSMTASAADNFNNSQTRIYLDQKNYPNIPGWWYWYAAGDSITGWIEGRGLPDTLEDTVDIVAGDDDGMGGCDPIPTLSDVRLRHDNVAIDPTTGRGTFTFPADQTRYLSDGYYCAWVAPGDYLEGGSAATYIRSAAFEIHLYQIVASTNKGGYIPGDTVKIFYTVSKIQDGSLVTDANFTGNWLVESTDGQTVWFGLLTSATGTFQYTIINTGGVNSGGVFYPTYIWYNGTSGGARREASWYQSIPVGNLGASIDNPSSGDRFAPGDIVQVEISVYVLVGGNPAYPGASVNLKILNGSSTTSPGVPGYDFTFTSDAMGKVNYLFELGASFPATRTYTVLVNATSVLKYASTSEWFEVRTVSEPIIVRMTFDKLWYYSGDTVSLTISTQPPAGHSAPSTYVYEVSSGTTLFARQTSTLNTYTFTIPSNFESYPPDPGLRFYVEVYNVQGDYGSASSTKNVYFGVMIVNADPYQYVAGDTITVNYELVTTVMGQTTTPAFFYTVVTASGAEVEQGQLSTSGLSGSFTYVIPAVPSTSYTFHVYASDAGRVVSGSAGASLTRGYILKISFDKPYYEPEETMTIEYELISRSPDSPLPSVLYLSYGLLYMPYDSHSTTTTTGSVTYKIPANTNPGYVLFSMNEGNSGAYALEMIQIGSVERPGTVFGVEYFDWFLLVIIVIMFLLLMGMRSRAAEAEAKPKVKEEKAAAPPPPGQASPMVVNCKACNAPIEITTSKRPIEVMCPSCGETAMVE